MNKFKLSFSAHSSSNEDHSSSSIKQELNLPSPSNHTVMEDISASSQPSSPSKSKKGKLGDENAAQDSTESTGCGSESESSAVQDALTLEYGSPAFKDVPSGNHRGHLCFGCCCDMRRAVIIVNSISLALALFFIVICIIVIAAYDEISNDDDEESLEDVLNRDGLSKGFVGFCIGLALMSMFFYSLGIRGAKIFNACDVGAALFYHCLSAIMNLVNLNVGLVILAVLCIYPHIMLIRQIRKGIMTKENYVNERRVCCV